MRKRLLTVIVCILVYGIIYILNKYFFDIGKPYDMYTISWTSRRVLLISLIISIAAAMIGKQYLANISVTGYILGIVTGELFGGFEVNTPPQFRHHGWFIWGCVFVLSLIVGVLVEIVYKHRSNKHTV